MNFDIELHCCPNLMKNRRRALLPLEEGGRAKREPDRRKPQEKGRMRAGFDAFPDPHPALRCPQDSWGYSLVKEGSSLVARSLLPNCPTPRAEKTRGQQT